jgi:hypothetical protein
MIVATTRPYFCPYPGFFYKAHLSDILVLLDDVQFPQGTTWITRNRFKNDQGALWMTVPVWKKGLGVQQINNVRICYEGRWTRKHLASLRSAYGNAPFVDDHLSLIEAMFSGRFERLIDLNVEIINYLMTSLQIETSMVSLSELGVRGRGTGLLIEICKAMNGSTFLIQRQAEKFLNADLFRRNGIELRFFTYAAPVYPQLWGDFLANLSALDLICNCGSRAHHMLLRNQPVPA